MGFYESKWLNEYNLNKPKFNLRYVDDILAAFEKEQVSINFLNFLNNKHPNNNIKFTIENKLTILSLFLLYWFFRYQSFSSSFVKRK